VTIEQLEAMQTLLAEFRAREGRDPTSKERGAIGRRAAERGHKNGTTPTDLRSLWQRVAAAVGVTPDVLEASIGTAAAAAPVEQQQISVAVVVAAVGERRSAWHRLDVIQHSATPSGPWCFAVPQAGIEPATHGLGNRCSLH
jgi:hypothetical protein